MTSQCKRRINIDSKAYTSDRVLGRIKVFGLNHRDLRSRNTNVTTSQTVLNGQYFENDYTKDEKKGSHVERIERREMYACKNYYII
jgi:hypothetical protein